MATKPIVTIGRQYGSGGRYVGKLLAEKLDIPFYDKEVLTLAAKDSGISEALFKQQEEQPTRSLLYSMVTSYQLQGDVSPFYMDIPLNHKIFLAQFESIKKIAAQGPCVIVGRCADYVLGEHKNVVKCFIYGDMASRAHRVQTYYGVEAANVEAFIAKKDRQRANYYDYYAQGKWGDVTNYHMAVDTGAVGVGGAVEMVLKFIELRREREK